MQNQSFLNINLSYTESGTRSVTRLSQKFSCKFHWLMGCATAARELLERNPQSLFDRPSASSVPLGLDRVTRGRVLACPMGYQVLWNTINDKLKFMHIDTFVIFEPSGHKEKTCTNCQEKMHSESVKGGHSQTTSRRQSDGRPIPSFTPCNQ